MLTDKEILETAIRKVGTKAGLARIFGVSPQSVSDWGKRRPIPRHLRPRLESFISIGQPTNERSSSVEKPMWMKDEFREIRRFTACVEQLVRIADDPEKLKVAEAVLKVISGWKDEEHWKEIFDRKLDHWIRLVKHRLQEEHRMKV